MAQEAARGGQREQASVSLRVLGRVRDALTGGVPDGTTLCVSLGHRKVASAAPNSDGGFDLAVGLGEPGRHLITVFADGRAPDRRGVDVTSDQRVDLGDIELFPVEYPPGVHGTLWDATNDAAIAGGGRVRLSQPGTGELASVAADPDGRFTIDVTCTRPVPPGEYDLDAEAGGYESTRIPFHVTESRTVHEVGHVSLTPAGAAP